MESTRQRRAPSIPSAGSSSLIVWAGHHSRVRSTEVDRRVVGAIAKPLVHAGSDSRAIAEALNAGLGVALPGEAWRNQLEPGHEKRREAFEMLAFSQRGQLDVRQQWSTRFIEQYATDHLDAQMKAGATLVTSAAHVHADEGGNGRRNDLLLARAAVEEFRARRGHHPLREGWPWRAVLASIMVQGALLQDGAERLVDQYSEVDADGYWIVVANTRRSAAEIGATATLAFGLQATTGRPAVVSCIGRPHAAFLAYGLAAVCSGQNRGSFAFPPTVWPESNDDEDGQAGIGVHVYHERVRGAMALGEKGQPIMDEAFARWPCRCNAHPSSRPPADGSQKLAHNQRVLELEAAEMCDVPLARRPGLLDRWLKDAAAARGHLGIGQLNPGWRAVGQRLDELGSHAQRTCGS